MEAERHHEPHGRLPQPAGGDEDSNTYVVHQAIALAVQDSVSHLRSMEALATAVTGVSLNGLVRAAGDREADRYMSAMYAASLAVDRAADNFEKIVGVAERLLGPSTELG